MMISEALKPTLNEIDSSGMPVTQMNAKNAGHPYLTMREREGKERKW